MVDYYKELGVHRNATSNEIRRAYKRLALIWHPDRNKAKDAEEKFKKIKHAYDVLIDENQRREYDRTYSEKKRTTNMKYTQPQDGMKNKFENSFFVFLFRSIQSLCIR
jgi:molecular chaperone DnaJ